MCCILEDSRLVQLQQEGGASLSRLRTTSSSEEERAATASVSELYEQVDELLHRLVTLSNRRTEELRFVVDFAGVERGLGEVSAGRPAHWPADSALLCSDKCCVSR